MPKFRIRKPGRGRIAIIAVFAVLLVLVLSARSLSAFYVNVLWHRSIGRTDVYWGIPRAKFLLVGALDRKSTRLNSSHVSESRMPSSA